ncbi:cation:proton antiporter [Actinoplanes sp. NBC_00393]|uniref:cation:proton antiporter domain-containing protein n=1 Tax=Actinoplanes sp. NBC_00393 TaxID=2975953 RepID=UPI002E236B3F
MILSLVVIAAVTGVWALVAGRLRRWHVQLPLVMVLAGIVVGLHPGNTVVETLNSEVAQHAAEVILAVLLFVDATKIGGGRLLGDEPGLAVRMLVLALPLSIAVAFLLGAVLLPATFGWPALLLIACMLVPIDLNPAESLLAGGFVPARVRGVLSVESGYNDGFVSPVFAFALILAGTSSQADTPMEALGTAVPSAVTAIVSGLLFGAAIASLMNVTQRAGWMTGQSRRIAVVVAPLLSYTATVAVGGNGFVASFVCGITFRYLREVVPRRRIKEVHTTDDLQLLEDVTALLTIGMWLYLGNATVLAVRDGVSWRIVLFCVAVLTVVRFVPVQLAAIGSALSRRERLALAAIGPRGTSSVVFGLLAFNDLPAGELADTALTAMTITVVGGVLLFGGLPVGLVDRAVSRVRKQPC